MSTAHLSLRIAVAFAAGLIPFSFLMGKLFGRGIGAFGKTNPGSVTAFRAGGLKAGIPHVILDSFKGVIPVLSLAITGAGPNMWGLFAASLAVVSFKHAQYSATAQVKQ